MKLSLIALVLCFCYLNSVFASQCQLSTASLEQMEEKFIELIDDSGESVLLRVKIADESSEQAAGFQHVCPQTIDTTAILFVFEKAKKPLFHMNNVYADLDIAFFDDEGRVGDIQLMREEFSTGKVKYYPSDVMAKYALEAHAGFFSAHNISVTDSWLKVDG